MHCTRAVQRHHVVQHLHTYAFRAQKPPCTTLLPRGAVCGQPLARLNYAGNLPQQLGPATEKGSAWERRPLQSATHNPQPSWVQAELLPRDLASFHSVSNGAPSAAAARTGAGPDLRGPFASWLNGGASRLPLREMPRQRLVAEPLCGWPALPTSGQLRDGGTLPIR